MEQTAVEWLVSKLPQRMLNYLKEEIEQAKEMEKEQQEKMYSEEDMRKAFKSSSLTNMLDVYESFEEFIEQFKNK
jgi:predicted ATP-binding protein involved in virulence